jgi:uncharacterized protein YjgD (DUF1641 family)
MPTPMEKISQEEITISFNGEETEFMMHLIDYCASLGILDKKRRIALAILDKFGPGIEEKAAKQLRLMRDELN